MIDIKIGHGYDVHQLVENRKLVLAGIEIPYFKGLKGHSDADVLTHALCDSILGALAMGDIGKHFPDNDPAFKNISSLILLRKIVELMKSEYYSFGNCDITVIAQEPKLSPFILQMRENLANTIGCPISSVSIKATTEENLGFTGSGEGISCHAVTLIQYNRS